MMVGLFGMMVRLFGMIIHCVSCVLHPLLWVSQLLVRREKR